MHVYLAAKIGTGTYDDPFRAELAVVGADIGVIDVAHDSFMLVLSPIALSGLIDIGFTTDSIKNNQRNRLNAAGYEAIGDTVGEVIFNFLETPTKPGLQPLTRGANNKKELRARGQLIYEKT